MSVTSAVIRLAPDDDVVVARADLCAGQRVEHHDLAVVSDTPRGHKIAVRHMRQGEPIHKLSQIIGFATCDIERGEHVHVHNCKSTDLEIELEPGSRASRTNHVPETERHRFRGFRRLSGAVGTRNYIGVITTVNCAATVARQACMKMETSGLLDDFPGVDGVVPVIHTTGCGMAGDGIGIEILQRTLHGYARHPNFAAVLIVGLGCEVNQTTDLMAAYGLEANDHLQTMTIQANHGTRQTIEAIIKRVSHMLPEVNGHTREWMPVSELKMALQCGASDGYSAITANPALGVNSAPDG